MIISHEHRFIFIKTVKTAGTSLEIALSRFCGDDDVITPISAEDEALRRSLGYRGPQNCEIPFAAYPKGAWFKALLTGRPRAFYNHAPAWLVKAVVGDEVWNGYFKFCFERNPWDKFISWYYWANKREPRPSIGEFLATRKAAGIRGYELYSIDGAVAVDKIYRFEELPAALEDLTRRLGLPEVPELPNAKSGYRKDKRSYRDVLSPAERDAIARIYAREIACMGYTW